ncbi:DUF1413 domain-containing protein [Pontibacillus litoralis]|uniref:DUF1413 domain-containing protein n=1 Tax=Pontibacillus litoralis JSM 072002 TaxID=1385512 RepID=A0A0A5GDH9_9BACI|nr:DUF1413 domain-containing protein [Pontibacillus litoralis]KGX89175.1 hypothetical protein N784_02290 [Pontibacillus litoralis JSM 072002]
MKVNVDTSLNDLFNIATTTLQDVDQGEEFIVKDLFRGVEWKRIAKGNRTKLGSMFFAFANGEGNELIQPLGKTPQNQQIYKKL